ncbi:DUF413 domain-containing protein [Alteromonas lipolytica]|uniref:Macrodomain Ori protein n=1 Tax=Alteromonas lipolytica TaxID=1856405 RepID=A0A1E8FG19_9ALTE|nr:DUF413 domain-containing protein [Alteromonas lipolytica]OFI34871.1 hypothetical protein BFC17_14970 [Alteromonas lipolytica]GGF54708.1 hypothetical protein GCM10011338_03620 [Alteromonas lipolytica]
MKTTDIRVPSKQFIDRQHFPYGFRKSGDFSISEADALSAYGKTLAALESGELTPENAEEQRFIAVLKGEEAATSCLEKAWIKYIKLARNRKQFYTLHSSASNQSDYDDDYSDDEFDVA